MQNEIESLLTVKETAEKLKLCPMKVFRMCWSGELKSCTIGRARRVHPDAVRQLIETGTTEKQAA